ncbi:MAG: hypothetical protein ACREFY_03560 [Acetobacteraceae bacterium]
MANPNRTRHFDLTIDPMGNRFGATPIAGSMTVAKNSPMAPVTEELATFRNSLGWIDSMILNRQTKKEAQKAAAHAYLQLIEAQKQLLVTKITLGLDAAKKRLLIDSLHMSAAMDQEIQQLSSEYSTMMLGTALDAGLGAAEDETRRLAQIETAYRAGKMTAARYEQAREMASEAADNVIAITKDAACRLIRGHIGKLEISLEQFKESVLGGSRAAPGQ